MKYKFTVILLLLLALSLTSAYAGNETRSGTAGALELLIPYGSRGTAMGGSVLSTTSGVESMYWNPAGLASLEGTEALFTHLPYFADIDVNYIGIATNIEGFGTLGAGAKIVTIGDMIETTDADPDGTGRDFSPSLMVLNISYAKTLTANVKFGFSGMFIHENIHEAKASGMAFDAGFIYDPRWKGLTMGITIKNYGTEMQFNGIGFDRSLDNRPVRPIGASFDLPSSINFGIGYDFIDEGPNYALISGSFQSNNYSADSWFGGAEYVYDDMFSIRGGYNYSEQTEYLYGFSFGAGVTLPFGESSITFEYTWKEADIFDDNQFFTVRTNF